MAQPAAPTSLSQLSEALGRSRGRAPIRAPIVGLLQGEVPHVAGVSTVTFQSLPLSRLGGETVAVGHQAARFWFSTSPRTTLRGAPPTVETHHDGLPREPSRRRWGNSWCSGDEMTFAPLDQPRESDRRLALHDQVAAEYTVLFDNR